MKIEILQKTNSTIKTLTVGLSMLWGSSSFAVASNYKCTIENEKTHVLELNLTDSYHGTARILIDDIKTDLKIEWKNKEGGGFRIFNSKSGFSATTKIGSSYADQYGGGYFMIGHMLYISKSNELIDADMTCELN